MSRTILLPTDGNPPAALIEQCMRQAQAQAASVVGLYVLPCDDLSTPEDDHYVLESERPCSVVYAANALRAIEHAAATAGVPCVVLTRSAESPYAAMVQTAHERGCDGVFFDALTCKPDAAEQASLRRLMAAADIAGGKPPAPIL